MPAPLPAAGPGSAAGSSTSSNSSVGGWLSVGLGDDRHRFRFEGDVNRCQRRLRLVVVVNDGFGHALVRRAFEILGALLGENRRVASIGRSLARAVAQQRRQHAACGVRRSRRVEHGNRQRLDVRRRDVERRAGVRPAPLHLSARGTPT